MKLRTTFSLEHHDIAAADVRRHPGVSGACRIHYDRRWLVRVLTGWHAAGDELGFYAVEDGLEAELEAVVGRCSVVSYGCFEARA
jgi:hypothetical protein